ncbi:MAG: lipopolysaccharide biosynthesis protein [Myxococcota bacterium]|nr:lipopolysaccharide biosynthesis protein [Myxococcota bacterium]
MAQQSAGLRLFREGGLYTFAIFLLRGGNFLLIPLYITLLEPRDYGAFGVVKQLVTVLVLLAVAAQGHSLLRLGVDADEDEEQKARLVSSVFSWVFISSCVLAGGAALCWPWLSRWLDDLELWPIGAAGLLAVAGMSIFQLTLSWLQFNRRARRHTVLSITRWVVMMVLILVFLLVFDMGAAGILLAMAVSFTVGALLGLRSLPRGSSPRKIHGKTLFASLSYGLPVLPHTLSAVIFASTDQVLLAANDKYGLKTAGIYFLAFQLASAVYMIAMGMQKAWMPFFLREDRDHATGGWNRVRVLSFFSVTMVGCAAVAAGLLAPELVALAGYFGDGSFQAAATIVPILCFGAFIRSYYLVASGVVLANKTVARWIAVATLPSAALNILLNALWIPEHGMYGAAWATATSWIVCMLAMGGLARHARKVPFKYGRATALLALVGAALWLGTSQALGLRIVILIGFGLLILLLDGRDILSALRSLRRNRGSAPETDAGEPG